MANDDVKVTAKKGADVRLVHRPTESAWKLWEMDSNKMVAGRAFPSRDSALAFAKKHDWNVHEGRKAPKAAAKTSSKAVKVESHKPSAAAEKEEARRLVGSDRRKKAKAPKKQKQARKGATTEGTEGASAAEASEPDSGKRINLLAPNGGDRPVASPPAGAPNFHPVPKPGNQKKKEGSKA